MRVFEIVFMQLENDLVGVRVAGRVENGGFSGRGGAGCAIKKLALYLEGNRSQFIEFPCKFMGGAGAHSTFKYCTASNQTPQTPRDKKKKGNVGRSS